MSGIPIPNDAYDGLLSTCASASVPVPDNFNYLSFKVFVQVVHAGLGELVMFLVPPTPLNEPVKRLELMHRPGVDAPDDGTNNGGSKVELLYTLTFDDAATLSSENLENLASAKIIPDGATVSSSGINYPKISTVFNGNALGTWTLYVGDAVPGGNSGTIRAFGLKFSEQESPSTRPSSKPSSKPSTKPSAKPSSKPSSTPSECIAKFHA